MQCSCYARATLAGVADVSGERSARDLRITGDRPEMGRHGEATPSVREEQRLTKVEGSAALLERLRREERATWGVDPDGTAYIDAAERIERVRAMYRARVAEEEHEKASAEERRTIVIGVGAELL